MDIKKLLDDKFKKINDDNKLLNISLTKIKSVNFNDFKMHHKEYLSKNKKKLQDYNLSKDKTINLYEKRLSEEKDFALKDAEYNKAVGLFENKEYMEALLLFRSRLISSHRDSKEYSSKCINIIFDQGVSLFNEGKYNDALNVFTSIEYYLNDKQKEMITKCNDTIECIRLEKERQILLKRQQEQLIEKKKKTRNTIISLSTASILVATAVTLVFTVFIPKDKQAKYDHAIELLEQGNYEEAIAKLETLDFKDSATQIKIANAGQKFYAGNFLDGIKEMCDAGGIINVTYDGDGGINYLTNETIEASKDINNLPTKEYYNFIGWTMENYSIDSDENLYSCDLKLKANYEVISYQINYNLDGGINDSSNITSYDISKGTISIKQPTKKGYIFEGWYDGENTFLDYKLSSLKEDLQLAAKWKAKEYDVVVDPDGGNYSDNLNFKIKYDSLVNLQVPTKIGYTFEGWYADKEKLGESWNIDNDSSITIKAKWSTTKFDITYNLDGGQNNSSNPTSITYFDDITILNPTKEGYTFLGWEVNDGSNYVENLIFSDVLNDMKLTAKWKINDYRITFSCEGVDINNQNLDVTYSQKPSLSTPTKLGAVFIGWYYNDVLVDEDWTMPACDITLEGRWSINQYNITYNLDGGTNNSSNPKNITYFDDITVYNPTKEGHTFLGWRVNNGTDFVLEPQFNDILDNITLTAYWEINEYTISFNYNGGDTGVSSIDVLYEDKPNLPIPTKLAYDFIGWYYNDTLVDEDWKMPGNNVTLVAKWEDPFLKYVEYYSGYSGITIKKMKSGYNNTALIVPDKINGKTVYEIKENAFAGLSCVKYLEISNSVSIINYGAFNGMSGLEKIKIPFIGHTKAMASTYMGDWLFGYVFGDGSYQQYTSFYKNGDTVTTSGAYSYGIPLSLKEIIVSGNCYLIRGALSNLYNVEKITFLGSIGRSGVESGAFYNCSSLTELYIPNNTYQIYGLAFYNCTKLTKLSIPSSSIIVSDSAFLNCPATVVYR